MAMVRTMDNSQQEMRRNTIQREQQEAEVREQHNQMMEIFNQ